MLGKCRIVTRGFLCARPFSHARLRFDSGAGLFVPWDALRMRRRAVLSGPACDSATRPWQNAGQVPKRLTRLPLRYAHVPPFPLTDRIIDYKHHPSDVNAGAIIGIMSAAVVFARGVGLYARIRPRVVARSGLAATANAHTIV